MKHLRIVVVVLGILWAASCSSTSNSTATPQPTRNTEKFSVSTETGSGTFTPALNIQESGDTTTVTVKAQDASSLSEAYVHLNYDATKYTPTEVTFGDFLGKPEQVVTLSLTEVSGDVQLGAAQLASGGALPQNGVGVLATVTFQNTPFTAGHGVSSFPKGNYNAVSDLSLTQNGSDVTLHWTEVNKGDYNNDGLVSITDLSPIALYYGQQVSATSDPLHAAMIDGDGNGEVNIADLTPIGANLGNQITGYCIYSDAAGTSLLTTVNRPAQATINVKRPVEYTQDLTTSGGEEFTVRGLGTTSSETGKESNVAAPTANEPGEPQAPTNLQATVGQAIGVLAVQLNWTASTSPDVDEYKIESKLSTDPDTSFALVTSVPKTQTQYKVNAGLTDADYDFRVWAVDTESLTSLAPSNTATGHPYVETINPPTNLNAQTGAGAAGIDLSWTADDTNYFFNVYRKGPGESTFTKVNASPLPKIGGTVFSDGGLTEHETYEYYVTGLDQFKLTESGESNHSSADASDALVLAVVSVTTDKTTHFKGGTEPDSNITAVANTNQATWTWTASQGTINGSGDSVTWTCPSNATVAPVTVTATAHYGAQQASMDLTLCITNETIKTQYGNNGYFYDWNPSAPSVQQPNSPYRPLSYYVGNGDKVVLYDCWGIWCYWCKRGMPNIKFITDYYPDFYYVGCNNSGETTGDVTNYFTNPIFVAKQHPGMNYIDPQWDSYQGTDPHLSAYGMGSSYPTAVVFDRDGFVRRQEVGAILDDSAQDLSDLVSELTGQAPALSTTWDSIND